MLRLLSSPESRYEYANMTLATGRDRQVQAYLTFDISGASPASICYGGRVESRENYRRSNRTLISRFSSLRWSTVPSSRRRKLRSLLPEFERVANAQARRDRLINLRSSLARSLRSLASIKDALQHVFLPTDQLIEVVEQVERSSAQRAWQRPFFSRGVQVLGKLC